MGAKSGSLAGVTSPIRFAREMGSPAAGGDGLVLVQGPAQDPAQDRDWDPKQARRAAAGRMAQPPARWRRAPKAAPQVRRAGRSPRRAGVLERVDAASATSLDIVT